MTLIELKDDAVTSVLPLYSDSYTNGQYFDDYHISESYDTSFDVRIKFENSSPFNYHTERSLIDENAVSDTIRYLFLQPTKFRSMTAEEFKENLKKIFRLFVEICLLFERSMIRYIYKLRLYPRLVIYSV